MVSVAASSVSIGNLVAIFTGFLAVLGILIAALVNMLNTRIGESAQQLSKQLDQVQGSLDRQSERIDKLSDKLADSAARTTANIDQLDRRIEKLEP